MTIKELVKISNGLFTKNLVNKNLSNKNINNTEFVFKNPIDFIINKNEKWCIIGDEKYNFLRIIKGDFFLFNSSNGSGNGNGNGNSIREYPIKLQDSKFNIDLLKFVNNNYGKSAFGSNTNGGFTHLGARYEFFKDFEIDENLVNFIINKSYNSRDKSIDETKLNYLLSNLKLFELKDKFINSLSNGQFRRARICKSLYSHPNLLLIDDPFLGLDPIAKELVSNVLNNSVSSIEGGNLIDGLCIGLRIQDDIPEWIENVAIVNKDGLFKKGHKLELTNDLQKLKDEYHDRNFQIQSKIIKEFQPSLINNSGGGSNNNSTLSTDAKNENIIEMNGVDVIYKGKHIIKDLKWQVKNGEKWHIRGKNGSGKTTLLSLITLDHPQSWNKKIKINGVERRTGSTNYFDNNKLIGFTSPELHTIFPKNLTIFESISTGYTVGSFLKPKGLTSEQIDKINYYLKLCDLLQIKDLKFNQVSISEQKLVLLIRSIINDPTILILDESLSAMNDTDLLKGKTIINNWDKGCVLVIGHVDEEIPICNKYLLLNDADKGIFEINDIN